MSFEERGGLSKPDALMVWVNTGETVRIGNHEVSGGDTRELRQDLVLHAWDRLLSEQVVVRPLSVSRYPETSVTRAALGKIATPEIDQEFLRLKSACTTKNGYVDNRVILPILRFHIWGVEVRQSLRVRGEALAHDVETAQKYTARLVLDQLRHGLIEDNASLALEARAVLNPVEVEAYVRIALESPDTFDKSEPTIKSVNPYDKAVIAVDARGIISDQEVAGFVFRGFGNDRLQNAWLALSARGILKDSEIKKYISDAMAGPITADSVPLALEAHKAGLLDGSIEEIANEAVIQSKGDAGKLAFTAVYASGVIGQRQSVEYINRFFEIIKNDTLLLVGQEGIFKAWEVLPAGAMEAFLEDLLARPTIQDRAINVIKIYLEYLLDKKKKIQTELLAAA